MIGAQLVVDPANRHLTIFETRVAEDDLAARILSFRHFVCERHHWPAERRRIHAIVYEGSPKRDLPAGIAGRRGKSREVARQHCSSGNERDLVRWILSHPGTLVPTEEEQLAFENRATESSAILITLDRVSLRCECVSGIEL